MIAREKKKVAFKGSEILGIELYMDGRTIAILRKTIFTHNVGEEDLYDFLPEKVELSNTLYCPS